MFRTVLETANYLPLKGGIVFRLPLPERISLEWAYVRHKAILRGGQAAKE